MRLQSLKVRISDCDTYYWLSLSRHYQVNIVIAQNLLTVLRLNLFLLSTLGLAVMAVTQLSLLSSQPPLGMFSPDSPGSVGSPALRLSPSPGPGASPRLLIWVSMTSLVETTRSLFFPPPPTTVVFSARLVRPNLLPPGNFFCSGLQDTRGEPRCF